MILSIIVIRKSSAGKKHKLWYLSAFKQMKAADDPYIPDENPEERRMGLG